MLNGPLTVVGVPVLVSTGAVGILAVPLCAVLGVGMFRLILRSSRKRGPTGT